VLSAVSHSAGGVTKEIPMSIGAMGASGSGNLNQILASLLSRIDPSTTSSTSTDDTDDTDFTPDAGSAPSNALTGSTSAQLSGDVLGVLMGLQQQSGTSAGSATGSSPLDQLFNAMDSDGGGSVSQSEMETYLGQQGATTGQADAVFASLDQNGSGGISETQMGSALQQSTQVHRGGGGGHHHHHGVSGSSSSQGADALLQAIDTDGNGSVSQDEFASFVTQNGGTTSEANQDFAALDTSGTGTLSSADFLSAIQNYQTSLSNGGSPMLNLLDTLAQNAGSTTSVTA
jgi:Ca2+-binding EF-hand superfamily protein